MSGGQLSFAPDLPSWYLLERGAVPAAVTHTLSMIRAEDLAWDTVTLNRHAAMGCRSHLIHACDLTDMLEIIFFRDDHVH